MVYVCKTSIPRSKSGKRFIYPLYPEWADRWELNARVLPRTGEHCNAKLGTKVAKWFKEHWENFPYHAYDLRHSYAKRCFEFGLPPDRASELMGHSLQIHLRTYRAWIDEATHRKAYEKILSRRDRPLPPSFPNY